MIVKGKNEGVYLTRDEGYGIKEECDEVAKYLAEQGIAFTELPCRGFWQPNLHVGMHRFEGVDGIKKGIERLLEREQKLEAKVN